MATDYRITGSSSRGLRNNNPGNIKEDGTAWQGAVGDDGTFYIFKDISWGLRALATDLANKIRGGVNTIRLIVTKYAPPSENRTADYISAVSADSGFSADQLLNQDAATLHALVRAIIDHELGDPFSGQVSDQDIDQGISMMNDNLLTIFKAGQIALQAAVMDPAGTVKWGNVAIGAAVAIGIYFLVTTEFE